MDYTKRKYETVIPIDLTTINIEQALYLSTFLKGKQRIALHRYFKHTLKYIQNEANLERRKELIEAYPFFAKLIDLADKFNQRDGRCLEDQCVLTHDKVPFNNLGPLIVVENGEIKVTGKKSIY